MVARDYGGTLVVFAVTLVLVNLGILGVGARLVLAKSLSVGALVSFHVLYLGLHGLRSLPHNFHDFLLGVGVFGSGDFSHTLLILYATRLLSPIHGAARAASLAVGLYTLHNVFYAGSAYVSGWLSDNVPHRKAILAGGYALAGVTAIFLTTTPASFWLLAGLFVSAGIYVGTEEALEDSLAAEIVPREQHGMAFGTLAAVNAIGDFLSSLVVGFLWSAISARAAFSFSAALFFLGAFFILRLRE